VEDQKLVGEEELEEEGQYFVYSDRVFVFFSPVPSLPSFPLSSLCLNLVSIYSSPFSSYLTFVPHEQCTCTLVSSRFHPPIVSFLSYWVVRGSCEIYKTRSFPDASYP